MEHKLKEEQEDIFARRYSAKPDSYLIRSILVTIFFCLPIGIPAIVYAVKTTRAWNENKITKAYRNANKSRRWILLAMICGLITWLVYLFMFFFMNQDPIWYFFNRL